MHRTCLQESDARRWVANGRDASRPLVNSSPSEAFTLLCGSIYEKKSNVRLRFFLKIAGSIAGLLGRTAMNLSSFVAVNIEP